MSRPWMPLYISDYLGDTQHLSTIEHGAYLLLIMQYWQKEGLPTDDAQLMRISRMAPDEWSNAKATLEALFQPGWKHPRIDAELQLSDEKFEARSKAGKKGGKASALVRRQSKQVTGEEKSKQDRSNASNNAAAKSNHPHPHPPIITVPSERTPVASTDPEKELFARGKQVLGKSAGGVIVKLMQAKGGNIALARAAIEQASTKQNPSEYIGAVIRGGAGPPAFPSRETNGFAEIANGNQQASDGYGSDHRIIDVTPNQQSGSGRIDGRKELTGR